MKARKRGARRAPPKGFPTWAAYMASIRKTKGKTKRKRKTKARAHHSTMRDTMHKRKKTAKRARRRGGHQAVAVMRVNPKHKIRRHRRNPPGLSMKGVLGFGIATAVDAGVLIGTRAVTRVWPQAVNLDAASTKGRAAQALVAVLAGGVLHGMGRSDLGAKIAAAGLSVPAEAMLHDMVKDSTNPMLASAFGDDTVLLSAYPAAMGAYPDRTSIRNIPAATSLGSYPAGRGTVPALNGYPASSAQQYQ